MPGRKRSPRREKQSRKGRTLAKQRSEEKRKDQTQQESNYNQPDIANLMSSSGKTVRELVNDLSEVASQLVKMIPISAETSTEATASISGQAEQEVQKPRQVRQLTPSPENQGKYSRTQEAA
jgi:ElaB/YqjD/DUF883 family membrane-anchored ribosome-binding protein